MNFEKKKDPLSSLGVGQIHMIRSWLDEMGVENYVINDDLSIDSHKDVNLSNRQLINFPNFIQFGHVDGEFICSHNRLVSLKGCPYYVGEGFYCHDNRLTSLEHCPSEVQYGFNCRENAVKFSIEYVQTLCDVHSIKTKVILIYV